MVLFDDIKFSDCNKNKKPNTRFNFVLMSILFSANHGTYAACIALATARLGDIGARQSGTWYLAYAASSLFGSTYVVQSLGVRDALILGMWVNCVYVGYFIAAASNPEIAGHSVGAMVAAAIGGFGGGFVWTAQGSYFGRASEEYARESLTSIERANAYFAWIFASIYLAEEVILKLLSTMLIKALSISWFDMFSIYTTVAIISAACMCFVYKYPDEKKDGKSTLEKLNAAFMLLIYDPKMKYMIFFNALFGFSVAFIHSFVSGVVVGIVLSDENSSLVGVLSSTTSAVASIMSVVLGKFSERNGNGSSLVIGSVSFFMVAFMFVLKPELSSWGWGTLLITYSFQGIGRATFEGALRAEFANFFASEKEGAFANIAFQNGLCSAIGFYLSINTPCLVPNTYCIELKNGLLHNYLYLELLVMIMAILALLGYWRAVLIFSQEEYKEKLQEEKTPLIIINEMKYVECKQ